MRWILVTGLAVMTLLAAGCATESTAGSVPAAAAAGSGGYDSARVRDNGDQADKPTRGGQSEAETRDSAQ